MPWDLELSEYNDLVFDGNRDLRKVILGDLVRQRMMLRLKIARGSWRFAKELGSDLRALLHAGNTAEQQARAASAVIQALRPMRDLSINSVEVKPHTTDPGAIVVFIDASWQQERAGLPQLNTQQPFVAEIPVPLAPAPAETTLRA